MLLLLVTLESLLKTVLLSLLQNDKTEGNVNGTKGKEGETEAEGKKKEKIRQKESEPPQHTNININSASNINNNNTQQNTRQQQQEHKLNGSENGGTTEDEGREGGDTATNKREIAKPLDLLEDNIVKWEDMKVCVLFGNSHSPPSPPLFLPPPPPIISSTCRHTHASTHAHTQVHTNAAPFFESFFVYYYFHPHIK